jgi:hypothetical protein
VCDAEAICHFLEGADGLAADCEEAQGQSGGSGHRGQNGGNAFNAPIISNQEENKVSVSKIEQAARFGTAGEPCRNGKLQGINAIRNQNSIAPEILREKIRGALRDSGEANAATAIDVAFQQG